MTRTTRWAASGVAALALLLAGFWGGRATPTSTATPREESGVVMLVGGGGFEFAFRPDGSHATAGYRLPIPIDWRDKWGVWRESQPDCMKPLTHGQHVTIGLVTVNPGSGIGGPRVVWLECQHHVVPRYPIVSVHPTPPAG